MWDDCLIEREKDIVRVILSNILNHFIVMFMIFFFFFFLKFFWNFLIWRVIKGLKIGKHLKPWEILCKKNYLFYISKWVSWWVGVLCVKRMGSICFFIALLPESCGTWFFSLFRVQWWCLGGVIRYRFTCLLARNIWETLEWWDLESYPSLLDVGCLAGMKC